MEEIYRVCGDRLRSYSRWPKGSIPALDLAAKMQRIVFDDVKFAFMMPALPKDASRYSSGDWAVLYTAKDPTVAIHEVAHHFRRKYLGEDHSAEFKQESKIIYRINAKFINQREVPVNSEFMNPDNYDICQLFAKTAVEDGCCSLKAPSVRHKGGICYPIFKEDILIISPSLEHRFLLRWYCKEDRLTHFAEGKEKDIHLNY